MRRLILLLILVAGSVSVVSPQNPPGFPLEEATIDDLQGWMQSSRYTAHQIAEMYLQRIEAIDRSGPTLRSVIEINPDALAIAAALDEERRSKGPRGPLHGIPVLMKDNIDTGDRMMTTAGSLALEGSIAPRDAFVVERLRAAGMVPLGKTNLSEWANFRASPSTSGWSGRGGQVKNPYALDRNPCGSSSGTAAAVAANLAAVGVGTETNGSIVCPSSANGLVGIKPTVGLVSRSGIIPISHSQDTAGPMTRTVTDAALLLTAMAASDPQDPATTQAARRQMDYRNALDPGALRGARIGVARKGFFGYSRWTDRLAEDAIASMKAQGAVIVDPADIPTAGELHGCQIEVLLYEFKAGLNKYLAGLPPSVRVRSLTDLILFNEREKEREMPYFGQELFVRADKKGPLSSPEYQKALSTCQTLAREKGIDAAMNEHKLDAIVAPTGSPAWLIDLVNGDAFRGSSSAPAAIAGYPNITVPMGMAFGLPVGMSFMGRPWSEEKLIGLAYAFERSTKHRRAPEFRPTALEER